MLTDLTIKKEYLPHSEEPSETFFRRVINESSFYQRAAGYFSSGVFSLFNVEFLQFAQRGGKIELICSNQLAKEDIDKLEENSKGVDIDQNIISQIRQLEKSEKASDALSFFATLMKIEVLSIKIAKYSTGGLFHDKTGCFTDKEGNSVTFRGSSNETYMGWSRYGNFETLETFCSWESKDKERVENHKNYLDRVWNNRQPELEVLSLSDLSKNQLVSKARKDIDDFRPILEKLREIEDAKPLSKTKTMKRTLKDFQEETLENWRAQGCRGIIKHATGSGKTVTAIGAILEHIEKGFPTIVAVPSILLLNQWRQEIQKDIPDTTILLCGGGNSQWKKASRLNHLLVTNSNQRGAIIIVILDTMVSSGFMGKLGNLKDVLLVADEAHCFGSEQAKSILNLDFGHRLGLSATPERHRDPEGTQAIFDFFGSVLKPIISIKDAIEKGRLVNYIYEPIPVQLDEMEMEEWDKLTKRIIQSGYPWDKQTSLAKREQMKMLFIKRSRIAKKAASKIPVATSIILKHYKEGEYWLVYCEDTEQLNQVDDVLRDRGKSPYIYRSGMEGSKEAELSDYVKRGGIMLSIKCLDEGIDIPKISHALIMASSQNPRQFIQRRGRVLRVDGEKQKAVIYDMFTIPNASSSNVPDGLLKSELRRAMEFSETALNKASALSRIRKVFINLEVELNTVSGSDNEPMIFEYEEN